MSIKLKYRMGCSKACIHVIAMNRFFCVPSFMCFIHSLFYVWRLSELWNFCVNLWDDNPTVEFIWVTYWLRYIFNCISSPFQKAFMISFELYLKSTYKSAFKTYDRLCSIKNLRYWISPCLFCRLPYFKKLMIFPDL